MDHGQVCRLQKQQISKNWQKSCKNIGSLSTNANTSAQIVLGAFLPLDVCSITLSHLVTEIHPYVVLSNVYMALKVYPNSWDFGFFFLFCPCVLRHHFVSIFYLARIDLIGKTTIIYSSEEV